MKNLSRAIACGAVLAAIAACTSQLPSARPLGGHSSAPTPIAQGGGPPPAASPAPRAKPAKRVATAPATPSAAATPSPSSAPSSTPEASPPNDDSASNPGSGPHPTVTLLSSGAAPRRVLRYRIKNGQHESLDMLMSLAMQMEINGHAMPNVPVPPMRAVMSLQTTQADAAGFAYTFSIDSFDVQSTPGASSALLNILHQKLGALVGAHGSASMTSRGFIRQAHIDVPAGVDPMIRHSLLALQHSMREMAHPLPKGAVGVGARWDVTSNVTVNSMRVQQVAHCHLVSLGAHRATLDERIQQTAAPQQLNLPTLPPGSSVELDDYHSHGKGRVVIDTSKITPVRSHVTVHGESTMQVTTRGHTLPMKAHIDMSVDITPH